jgi:hypothetical protein
LQALYRGDAAILPPSTVANEPVAQRRQRVIEKVLRHVVCGHLMICAVADAVG